MRRLSIRVDKNLKNSMTSESTKTEVGSYFISNYPPFSVWNDESVPQLIQAMNRPPTEEVPLGLYLHLPFCRKRCNFCYFRVFTDKTSSQVERYMLAIAKEIELVSKLPAMGNRPFKFVYFGGGTPSYLSPRQLERLVSRLRENIAWDQAEEVTFECEPGTLTEPKVEKLRELGITRLSLGIEHFTDSILEENGRAHVSKEVYRCWPWIQKAGFLNTNIDLIAGMVGDRWETWREAVERAIELNADSVTIYQMELPFNTKYSKEMLENGSESPVADWETKRAWVSYAFDEFAKIGYTQSSAFTMVKNPTAVNFSYRDNLWQGADLLSTGIASFGHISGLHYQNQAGWEDYLQPLEAGQLPLARAYQTKPLERLIREMVLTIKKGYLERDYYQQKFGADILAQWHDVWTRYEQEGYLVISAERITLTRKGLLEVDRLLPAFFEPEHQHVRYT